MVMIVIVVIMTPYKDVVIASEDVLEGKHASLLVKMFLMSRSRNNDSP
jgi:hypothetical protein